MQTANKTTEQPSETLTPQPAMMAVKIAKLITCICRLHASRRSQSMQRANTFNSLSVASPEFPPAIKIGIVVYMRCIRQSLKSFLKIGSNLKLDMKCKVSVIFQNCCRNFIKLCEQLFLIIGVSWKLISLNLSRVEKYS